MAFEIVDRFIMVNALCPGVFPSRMTAFGLNESRELLEAGQPTGRVGLPEDISGTVIMLASRAGSHITGTAISIDGGQMLQYIPKL